MRLRTILFLAVVTASCSLGLDASKIDAGSPTPDGGGPPPPVDAASPPDAPAPDVVDAATSPPPSSTCTQDADCGATNACASAGKCDLVSHVCVDPICPAASGCQAQVCNTATSTCGAPVPIGFFAGSFPIAAGGVGCGGSPSSCIAAEFPILFVGTTNGVVAFDVSDPTAASPPPVTLGGLAFLPNVLVQSGRRVYFVGGLEGTGPGFHVPVAWVDVPQVPGVTTLEATTAFVAYSDPRLDLVLPSDSGGLYLVNGDPTTFFRTARLESPISASTALSFFPCAGIAPGAGIVGASGARLVAMRWDNGGISPSYDAELALVNGAGTSAAQATTPEQPATAMGTVVGDGFVASAAGGQVLWNVPTLAGDDAGSFLTPSARVTWLASDGSSGYDESAHVDVESYSPPPNAGTQPVAGPLAAIDSNTAVVLAAAAGTSFQQASVQVAQRSGTTATLLAGRRHVIGATAGQVGVTTSNGYAYVLVLSDPQNNLSAEVQVLAPSCAGGDGG